ncbi:MAG: DNA adenine methylase [Polyangiaceae bacterium]|nr:DNA adenine methylase [Polyangiaceae bacterium]
MSVAFSPLRYPGGKQILSRILAHLVQINKYQGGIYVEPYCGGAGAALSLLFCEYVDRLMLNDADPNVHGFWHAILHDTESFLRLLHDTPVSVEEWCRQRDIYRHPDGQTPLALGFATFYLNRCNRSGIIAGAGLIGGLEQRGKWKLDARFNRAELARRIERVAMYRDRIALSNLDAIVFLRERVSVAPIAGRAFVYLDPPYYVKGSQLYLNHYKPVDHANLAAFMKQQADFVWIMTYDNVPEVHGLYRRFRRVPFDLGYSARDWRVGREIMILKPGLIFPARWREKIPDRFISAADGLSIPRAG